MRTISCSESGAPERIALLPSPQVSPRQASTAGRRRRRAGPIPGRAGVEADLAAAAFLQQRRKERNRGLPSRAPSCSLDPPELGGTPEPIAGACLCDTRAPRLPLASCGRRVSWRCRRRLRPRPARSRRRRAPSRPCPPRRRSRAFSACRRPSPRPRAPISPSSPGRRGAAGAAPRRRGRGGEDRERASIREPSAAVGEVGLMQIRPQTAAMLGYGGDAAGLFEPETNVRFGVAYLARAWELAGGDLCRALMKYRAGWGEERMTPLSVEYSRRGPGSPRGDRLAARGGHAGPNPPGRPRSGRPTSRGPSRLPARSRPPRPGRPRGRSDRAPSRHGCGWPPRRPTAPCRCRLRGRRCPSRRPSPAGRPLRQATKPPPSPPKVREASLAGARVPDPPRPVSPAASGRRGRRPRSAGRCGPSTIGAWPRSPPRRPGSDHVPCSKQGCVGSRTNAGSATLRAHFVRWGSGREFLRAGSHRVTGPGRRASFRSRIRRNRSRGTATSAIWKTV
jgi:hypothetical protein